MASKCKSVSFDTKLQAVDEVDKKVKFKHQILVIQSDTEKCLYIISSHRTFCFVVSSNLWSRLPENIAEVHKIMKV